MRLGILSDTHGSLDWATKGVRLLTDAGVDYLVHCGDVGSTSVLDQLAGTPAAFVFGNCDYDAEEYQRHARIIGVTCLGFGGMLPIDGPRVFVAHGDQPSQINQALTGHADYLLCGHTHIAAETRSGTTHIINPGALVRANPRTVAVLDLSDGQVRFHTVT